MKRLKKFDISKCKDPKKVIPNTEPIKMTPLDEIEFSWQRERAKIFQDEYFSVINEINKIQNWDELLENKIKELQEEVKKTSH